MIGPLIIGVAVIIVDKLLQAVGGAGKDRGHGERDDGDVRRPADDDLGVVEPVPNQSDEQAELQKQHRKRQRNPGDRLDQKLMPEGPGRPFEIIARDGNPAQHGITGKAEERPTDLLAKIDRFGLPQATQQHQHRDDHEAHEAGLIERAVKEHQDRQRGEQGDNPPRQLAVREQHDPGQKQDIAEIVERDIEPARNAEIRQEYRGRLLRADRHQDREREDGADRIARIATVEDPCRPQQERIGNDVKQVDEAQHLRRNADRLRARIDVLLAGRHRDLADIPGGVAHGQRNLGSVGPEQHIAHGDVGGIIGMLRPKLPR